MPLPAEKSRVVRFGVFEVNLQEAELRKSGIRIKLQEQPFQILAMLLERPGQTVSREELRLKLWPADTFVDFDHSLNSSINKLREALGDNSENPRFIETLHRRGYRFIATVEGATPRTVRPAQSIAPPPSTEVTPSVAGVSGAAVAAPKRRRWELVVAAVTAVIVIGAAGLRFYFVLHSKPHEAPKPFQNFVVTQVTNSGTVKAADISPDGRYVASVLNDKGMQSLWLRNLPTGSDTQIIPASKADYDCIRFSPDGNYIYFIMGKNANWDGYNLFRSPVLGGNPQFVLGYLNWLTCYAFSPDGQQIVVGRLNYPEATKYQILTTTSGGGNETILQAGSTTKQPWHFAWHPNGHEIYYSFYSREEGLWAIDVFDLRAGKSHRFLSFKDKYVAPLSWLPDGQTLLVWFGGQIGFIRSITREVEPITRDAHGFYWKATVSADGKTIAAVPMRGRMTGSVLSRAGSQFKNPLEVFSQPDSDVPGLAWSDDGDLRMVSRDRLLKLGADGKNQQLLLADTNADIASLAPCGTSYLIFHGNYPRGTNFVTIWRTNADGSHPVKLTNGKFDFYPVCSPDLKWVYYLELISSTLSRVPLDGSGKAEPIFDVPPNYYFAGGLTISNDGKTLAAPLHKTPTMGIDIALFELGSHGPPRVIAADIFSADMADLQSTHDGNSVAYVKRQDGVDNLWVNRLDGSAPYPITDFTSDHIWGFSFSLDGKRLAVLRGHWESDVVLLQETKP